MSTTVTYKGSTLATVENQTKKLDTAGTWLEDDITITDSSSGGGEVLVVDTHDSHGGTIREITVTDAVYLQGQKAVTLSTSPQTISPDTGYTGFTSVVVTDPNDRGDLTVPKDVDFIDFDGRLLYSYTAQEFLALTALPANPSYPGLTAQGWNWSLSDAKTYVQEWGALVIGQSYITDDGKTRAYLHVTQEQVDHSFPLKIYVYAVTSGGGVIDWGDNTSTTTITSGTGNKNYSHTYASAGDYKIEIEITSGTFSAGYHGSWQNFIGGSAASNNNDGRLNSSVYKIEMGSGFTGFGRQPFSWNINLESVSIPTSITGFNDTGSPDDQCLASPVMKGMVLPSGFQGKNQVMFGNTGSGGELRYISVPKSTTLFGIKNNGANFAHLRKLTLYSMESATPAIKLSYCKYELTHFIMPGTYTTLIDGTCAGSLITKFTIPATVTTLQTDCLIYNYFLTELHVLPTTVPTMNNVRALNGLSPNAVIYVPYSADHSILAAYQSASNWSSFASYMQEEPQS